MLWNYFHNNHNGWFYAYGLVNEGISFFVLLLLLRSRKSIFTMITLCDLILIFLWWFWCLGVIKLFSHKSHLVILPIWTCKWMCFIFSWCFCCLDVKNYSHICWFLTILDLHIVIKYLFQGSLIVIRELIDTIVQLVYDSNQEA